MKLPFSEKVKARQAAARERKAKEHFKKIYIATHPVDFSAITQYRNDAFPESGPFEPAKCSPGDRAQRAK
jgi:hypothetical protein